MIINTYCNVRRVNKIIQTHLLRARFSRIPESAAAASAGRGRVPQRRTQQQLPGAGADDAYEPGERHVCAVCRCSLE